MGVWDKEEGALVDDGVGEVGVGWERRSLSVRKAGERNDIKVQGYGSIILVLLCMCARACSRGSKRCMSMLSSS